MSANEVQAFALPQGERVLLAGLTKHPGYPVLVKMAQAACQRAYAKVVECDPIKEAEVLALQKEARAASVFCEVFFKAIAWHAICENVTGSQAA